MSVREEDKDEQGEDRLEMSVREEDKGYQKENRLAFPITEKDPEYLTRKKLICCGVLDKSNLKEDRNRVIDWPLPLSSLTTTTTTTTYA
ncbi:hypothetical protein E2C01_096288 [Portunus trituberculatus]|uniref:Uncharacterized protein n=1 Tax=Portunus trituberculatus TaxID=210409 RepID=A0A5B7K6I4_PORTR|nr:hypothetical protein [Portunus trituberculatus]